jgi:hypothetical protein
VTALPCALSQPRRGRLPEPLDGLVGVHGLGRVDADQPHRHLGTVDTHDQSVSIDDTHNPIRQRRGTDGEEETERQRLADH